MPIYATYINADQIDTEQLTGTSSLAVSASYSEFSTYAISSNESTTAIYASSAGSSTTASFSISSSRAQTSLSSSFAATASYALNSSNVNTGSFIQTSSIYRQNINGDLSTTNLFSTGSGSFGSVTIGTPETGMFRLRTSGSGINNVALTIEFYSGSWIECGYFKK